MQKSISNSLKIEEAAQFVLCLYLYSLLGFDWWIFAVFFLAPDLSMLGYLKSAGAGAWSYNLFHHKGLSIAICLIGYLYPNEPILITGFILYGHSAFDRMLGYGLKYEKGFKFTHLGTLGGDKT